MIDFLVGRKEKLKGFLRYSNCCDQTSVWRRRAMDPGFSGLGYAAGDSESYQELGALAYIR